MATARVLSTELKCTATWRNFHAAVLLALLAIGAGGVIYLRETYGLGRRPRTVPAPAGGQRHVGLDDCVRLHSDAARPDASEAGAHRGRSGAVARSDRGRPHDARSRELVGDVGLHSPSRHHLARLRSAA